MAIDVETLSAARSAIGEMISESADDVTTSSAL